MKDTELGNLPILTRELQHGLQPVRLKSATSNKPQAAETVADSKTSSTAGFERELDKIDYNTTVHNRGSTSHKLAELLSSYPIMASVADNLHYPDLLALSMASKSIKEAIFHSSDAAFMSNLENRCCRDNIKSKCYSCNMQVCTKINAMDFPGLVLTGYCGKPSYFPPPSGSRHIVHCFPLLLLLLPDHQLLRCAIRRADGKVHLLRCRSFEKHSAALSVLCCNAQGCRRAENCGQGEE